MNKKLQVYHFHNGGGGGVLSVIKNLIQFSKNDFIDNHVIYTINKEETPVFVAEDIQGAFSQNVFYYSPKWNFYYTCQQLVKLLPANDVLLVAHDWLELGMMSNLGLQNQLIFFVHGDYDYYYQLAQKHETAIDQFICVAENIKTKLVTLLPRRKENIAYLRFPVPYIINNRVLKQYFNIIFIGRLTTDKGYHLLPLIAKILCRQNIDVVWHVAGAAPNGMDTVVWDKEINVHFYGNVSNDRILSLLKDMQIFILPSIAEGMPVTIIEAMKAGAIPVVNNIEGGIQELVINNETGYKIDGNDLEAYTEKIIELINNRSLAETIKRNCIEKANNLFDPVDNTRMIEQKIQQVFASLRVKKNATRVYGSRLDQSWIPNIITKSVRSI